VTLTPPLGDKTGSCRRKMQAIAPLDVPYQIMYAAGSPELDLSLQTCVLGFDVVDE
jgi:hypothetical protein